MRLGHMLFGSVMVAVAGCRSAYTTGGPASAQLELRFGCETLDGGTIPGCTQDTVRLWGGQGLGQPPVTCLFDNVDESHGGVLFSFDLRRSDVALTISAVEMAVDRPSTNGWQHGWPAGPCTLTFRDGETYVAACGSGRPSAAQPCQLSVVVNRPTSGGPGPGGFINVHCVDVPSTTGASRRSVAGTVPSAGRQPPWTAADPPEAGEFWSCPVTRYY